MRTVWVTFDGDAFTVKLITVAGPLTFKVEGVQEFATLAGTETEGAPFYIQEWLTDGRVAY